MATSPSPNWLAHWRMRPALSGTPDTIAGSHLIVGFTYKKDTSRDGETPHEVKKTTR